MLKPLGVDSPAVFAECEWTFELCVETNYGAAQSSFMKLKPSKLFMTLPLCITWEMSPRHFKEAKLENCCHVHK